MCYGVSETGRSQQIKDCHKFWSALCEIVRSKIRKEKKKNIKGAEVLANMYMTWIEFQNRKKKTGCADTPSYHSTVGEKRSM